MAPFASTALAGGTGAAKLLRGLGRVLDARDLTVIVNTGDDTERHGLLVPLVQMHVDHAVGHLVGEREVAFGFAQQSSQASRASSTDPSSSIVVMSPGSRPRVTAFNTRRMIFPLLVFGNPLSATPAQT